MIESRKKLWRQHLAFQVSKFSLYYNFFSFQETKFISYSLNNSLIFEQISICNYFAGLESISIDVNDMKLVLLGDIDPVSKLRKWCTLN